MRANFVPPLKSPGLANISAFKVGGSRTAIDVIFFGAILYYVKFGLLKLLGLSINPTTQHSMC